MSENNALTKYTSRAIQRRVVRHKNLMKAKLQVGEEVIDAGSEIHDYAGTKTVEVAQFNHLMASVVANLNGKSEPALEQLQRLEASHREWTYETVQQSMRSLLLELADMPTELEDGPIEWVGDTVARLRDEWNGHNGG